MRTFQTVVRKGVAEPVSATLRQIALQLVDSWKPIGFSMNVDFNLMSAPVIVEDTYRVISNLSDLVYVPKDNIGQTDMIIETIKFTGQLFLGGDGAQLTHFDVQRTEYPVITSLSQDVLELTIVYRKGTGMYTAEDNKEFVTQRVQNSTKFLCVASRHSDLTRFDYRITPKSGVDEILFTLDSKVGNEEEIIQKSFEVIRSSFAQMEQSLVVGSTP